MRLLHQQPTEAHGPDGHGLLNRSVDVAGRALKGSRKTVKLPIISYLLKKLHSSDKNAQRAKAAIAVRT